MYGGIGDSIASALKFMFMLRCIFVPLGVWKFVDIILWIVKHVNIGVN